MPAWRTPAVVDTVDTLPAGEVSAQDLADGLERAVRARCHASRDHDL